MQSAHTKDFHLPLWGQALILFCAIAAVYSNTLDVPFYFDDRSSIVNNSAVHSLGDLASIWNFCQFRFIGYLSYAINYHFNGVDTTGYHLVNILLHFLTTISLLGLIRGLLQTPAVKGKLPENIELWLPVTACLLFAVHPLHTQAVTYIVQRLAILAALFYLVTLAAYIQARLANTPRSRVLWSAAVIFSMLLAFLSKQNTVTLPLAILMTEGVFFPENRKKLLSLSIVSAVAVVGLYALLHFGFGIAPFSLESFDALTRETKEISRIDYLATQTMVLWKYILLFLRPVGLHLDHDFPLADGFANWQVIAAILAHLGCLAAALLSSRRFPLLAFSIFIFYISHLVESSLIPIRDVLYEHRMYLPSSGLCIALAFLLLYATRHKLSGKKVFLAVLPVFIILGTLTWSRNTLWLDPVKLWRDNAEKAPHKERPLNNYGKILVNNGHFDEAIIQFKKVIEINPNYVVSLSNLGDAFIQKKDPVSAVRYLKLGLSKDPRWPELHYNMGRAMDQLGRYPEAIVYYTNVLNINPKRTDARNNLANALHKTNSPEEAIKHYYQAIHDNPNDSLPYYNLSAILYMQGKGTQALPLLKKLLELRPQYAQAYTLLGLVYSAQNNLDNAIVNYKKALSLDPGSKPQMAYRLAAVYARKKITDQSIHWLREAIRAGFTDWTRLKNDRELTPIHDTPFYQKIIADKG